MSQIGIGILISLVLGGPLALFLGIYLLANLRIFFTIPREGTVETIVTGDDGRFVRQVMTYEDHYLNDPSMPWYNSSKPDWEVLSDKENPKRKEFLAKPENSDPRPWLERHLGIFWIGPYPNFQILSYEFDWNEQALDENGKYVVKHRKERTNFIYVVDFPYMVLLDAAELVGNLSADIWYMLTVRVNNPYKALYRVAKGEWLKRVTAASNAKGRSFYGDKSYDQARSEEGALVETADDLGDRNWFGEVVRDLNNYIPGDPDNLGTQERYGVTCVATDVLKIDLVGDDQEEARKAATKRYIAEQQALARIAEAHGEAKAARIEGGGEARRIKLVYSQIGTSPERLSIRQAEAIEKSGAAGSNIVWANNPIPTLGGGGVDDLLKKFGVNSTEELLAILRQIEQRGDQS